MIKVEEATIDQFNEIYRLLQQLNNSSIARNTWKKCFENPFTAEEKRCGYILKESNKTVGFIGVLYSQRCINGQSFKFCNTHSWFVLPEYRSRGLLLLNKIHKQKGYVLTNFSASEVPYKIMKQLGWKDKEYRNSIVWKKLSVKANALQKNELHYCLDNIQWLHQFEKEIVEKHKQFRCNINVVGRDDQHSMQVFKQVPYCPKILSKIKLDGLFKFTLGQLYYVSNPGFFFENFEKYLCLICRRYGWTGMIIPDEYIQRYRLRSNRLYLKKRPILYKTDLEFSASDLDLLHSEVFVLDLN